MSLECGKASAFIAKQDPDRLSLHVADLLKSVSQLELLQAPGLSFTIAKEYQNRPRLTGRAVVGTPSPSFTHQHPPSLAL